MLLISTDGCRVFIRSSGVLKSLLPLATQPRHPSVHVPLLETISALALDPVTAMECVSASLHMSLVVLITNAEDNNVKRAAGTVLAVLAEACPDSQMAVIRCRAITAVEELLKSRDIACAAVAVRCLAATISDRAIRQELLSSRGCLISLLGHTSQVSKTDDNGMWVNTANVLASLSCEPQSESIFMECGALQALLNLTHGPIETRCLALSALANVTCNDSDVRIVLTTCGATERIINMLSVKVLRAINT